MCNTCFFSFFFPFFFSFFFSFDSFFKGCLLISTGILLGYIFIFAYCSVADATTSDTLLMSLISPMVELISLLGLFITRVVVLAKIYPMIETKIVNALVGTYRLQICKLIFFYLYLLSKTPEHVIV